MKVQELAFWQGEDGYDIVDILDERGADAAMVAMSEQLPDEDESVVTDMPDLPGYHMYRVTFNGLGYFVQVHFGMGHVALYAEV